MNLNKIKEVPKQTLDTDNCVIWFERDHSLFIFGLTCGLQYVVSRIKVWI